MDPLAPDAPAVGCCRVWAAPPGFSTDGSSTLAAGGSIAWLTAALLSGMRLEAHLLLALAIGTRMAVLVTAMILTGRAAPTNDVPGPRRARDFAVCPHREHARVRAV
jgi:hypothetical protein